MTAMPTFDSDAKCPKCWGEDIAATWTATAEHWCSAVHEERREHIHRVCRRCWFRWNEAPITPSDSREDSGIGEGGL